MVVNDTVAIRELIGKIEDPEIPVLTLADLGIIREVEQKGAKLTVTITPTYSGCPATSVIEDLIATQLTAAKVGDFEIQQTLSPPWSSRWITKSGREKLNAYGIAPPNETAKGQPNACPRCKSKSLTSLSAFGPTPCQAIWKCEDCLETFNYFKCI